MKGFLGHLSFKIYWLYQCSWVTKITSNFYKLFVSHKQNLEWTVNIATMFNFSYTGSLIHVSLNISTKGNKIQLSIFYF